MKIRIVMNYFRTLRINNNLNLNQLLNNKPKKVKHILLAHCWKVISINQDKMYINL